MKNDKSKKIPIEIRESIFETENKSKLNAKAVLANAKRIENQKLKTHYWVTSTDGKTKKLVKL